MASASPAPRSWSQADRQALADRVFADPSFGGMVAEPDDLSGLLASAVGAAASLIPSPDDRLAFINAKRQQFAQYPTFVAAAALLAKNAVLSKANVLLSRKDFAGAIQLASSPDILGEPSNGLSSSAICIISLAKTASASPDALGWAKLKYYFSAFQTSQSGINAIASALRAADLNLVRSNAFIQFQKDGQGENVLEAIPVPDAAAAALSNSSPLSAAIAALIKGDKPSALRIAFNSFASAETNDSLNAAVGLVAQILRNIDGNLIRANAFVTAQKNGEAFEITELK